MCSTDVVARQCCLQRRISLPSQSAHTLIADCDEGKGEGEGGVAGQRDKHRDKTVLC
jgi:hypothetical protein